MGLISIITINFNNAEGLHKTIKSVQEQTFQDFEFIIIDGGSDDDSVSILKESSCMHYWVSEPDNGIYNAMNKGIQRASGDYYCFLNSGDVFAGPDILSQVSKRLHSDKSLYYGNLLFEKEGSLERHVAPDCIDLDFMINSTFWHPTVFIKSAVFKRLGLYDESFKVCGDYEFFVRCFLSPNFTVEFMDIFVAIFDGNGVSNNPDSFDLIKGERKMAWLSNTSDWIYKSLLDYNRFKRSRFSNWVNAIQSIRKKEKY